MTTSAPSTIYAGDTSPVWELGLLDDAGELVALDGDFSCAIAVVEGPAASDGAEPLLQREVTARNEAGTRFLAWLTPDETAALGPGLKTVGIELRNPELDPPLVQEVHLRLRIRPQVVPAE